MNKVRKINGNKVIVWIVIISLVFALLGVMYLNSSSLNGLVVAKLIGKSPAENPLRLVAGDFLKNLPKNDKVNALKVEGDLNAAVRKRSVEK